uniref:Methylase n=1 Tax=uncultured bacterium lac146 TaxID=1447238 RepID=X2LCD6_9BACT|nr:methylase [uncultured bacterium lac146]
MIHVVTPCLNAADTIDLAITSVVTQAGNFEVRLHVQDGGSTDGTLDRLARWKRRLDGGHFPIACGGVTYTYSSSRDTGSYDGLIEGFSGLSIPRSAFMTWINADDILMPGALALVAKVERSFSEDAVSWLGGTTAVLKEGAQVAQADRPTPTRVVREGLCDGRHWHHVQQEGVFFRNWLWTVVNPETTMGHYRYAGAWNLWRRFARYAELVQAPWPLGASRLRPGQLLQASYLAEVDATVPRSARTEALKAIGEKGGAPRRLLRTGHPVDTLAVTEEAADDQAHYYYQRNFGRDPGRPIEKTMERVVGEGRARRGRRGRARTAAGAGAAASALRPESFDHYTYAKRSHWTLFDGLDIELYGQPQDPEQVMLKVYQDLLVLRFIRDNISPGARLLDVSGEKSRILAHLSSTYECWSIGKPDAPGHGTTDVGQQRYRLVQGPIGNFNPGLPGGYFDLVFSISAFQHVPQGNTSWFDSIIYDINRALRPGGYSLHLMDVILKKHGLWANTFTRYLFEKVRTVNRYVPEATMRADPDLYVMSEKAYMKTRPAFAEHGAPCSVNVLWRKPPEDAETARHVS